jgi:hypothetical protein
MRRRLVREQVGGVSFFRGLTALSLAVVLVGCAVITGYDATSYKTATDLKAQAAWLIEKAVDPPSAHKVEIEDLRLKLRQAYEYEAGKGTPNLVTVNQWKLLNDPGGGLIGGFLKKWESDNKGRSPDFLEEVTKQVEKGFDEIIKLEN